MQFEPLVKFIFGSMDGICEMRSQRIERARAQFIVLVIDEAGTFLFMYLRTKVH
jgi:hypothetical protein